MKKMLLENEHAKFVIEDGILIGSFKCEFVDLDLANKITGYRLELQNGKNFPILSNIKAVKSSTKSARDFLASEEGCKGVVAAAVLIDSPISSMIGNFFIRVSKPLRPTKIFTNETEAKKWLAQFVKKE
ncbi:MAG: hypothetical protein Q7W13_01395 [Bacteroidia bacterium]|nr:hypothetical protein [Bacteroidia bacterium]